MKRTEIITLFNDESAYTGKKLTVCGWIKTSRNSKNISFIELNDGSSFKNLQIVYNEDTINNYVEIAALNVGSAICVKGNLVATPEMKQPFELQAEEIIIEGASSPEYPLQKKRHSLEYLRTIQHLRPRTNTFSAAFRVRSVAAYAIHKFFNERGFVYAHTPLITTSDAEGAGEMFRVTTLDVGNPPLTEDGKVDFSEDFFGKGTSLTVSGQLQAEAMAMAFGKVYTFGPTFRAEKSYTARHAAEFWMIEPEIAFADLEDDMELAREQLCTLICNMYPEKFPAQKTCDFKDFKKVSSWAKTSVAAMAKAGVVTGTGNGKFEPKTVITRASLAQIIYAADI